MPKSDKTPAIICSDLKTLTERIDGCTSNSEKPLTRKIRQKIPCEYSVFLICIFDSIKYSMVYSEVKITLKFPTFPKKVRT